MTTLVGKPITPSLLTIFIQLGLADDAASVSFAEEHLPCTGLRNNVSE
jgi:hypothetical protein